MVSQSKPAVVVGNGNRLLPGRQSCGKSSGRWLCVGFCCRCTALLFRFVELNERNQLKLGQLEARALARLQGSQAQESEAEGHSSSCFQIIQRFLHPRLHAKRRRR